jgi:hypothetical protein
MGISVILISGVFLSSLFSLFKNSRRPVRSPCSQCVCVPLLPYFRFLFCVLAEGCSRLVLPRNSCSIYILRSNVVGEGRCWAYLSPLRLFFTSPYSTLCWGENWHIYCNKHQFRYTPNIRIRNKKAISTNADGLKKKTKLHGLRPRENYTDRATAACR